MVVDTTKRLGGAFVVYCPNGKIITRKLKLHSSCSVFQAELKAIEQACVWLADKHIPNAAILTDSKSGLQEIGNPNSTNQIVTNIHRMLDNHSLSVNFIWVKAHTGIAGNEAADLAAKAAATSHNVPILIKFPISFVRKLAQQDSKVASEQFYQDNMKGGLETADEVLARVKKAVDARGTGLKINKVRKAKNQKIILGCDTEDERKKVQQRIESRGDGLIVEPIKNKDPLVILKDVIIDSEDEDTIKALHAQNKDVFFGLNEKDMEMTVKYKKRTRNPRTVHIVLQVKPNVWQRMTEAGALYLDLQRVRVEDQSPLIQCTRCLAFGHGRKFCTESVDRCSHCGGPHLREKCADFSAGNEPQCCNCSHSGLRRTDHNAFSADCPVRKKWDYLARANTAYA
ncbi:unnamed protein product [Parnassius apollo]|uniref:(apollo) hypothetical protein n=1 Tax=Parnassius apollo TaxID=110799 RepID=A0A8S3YD24_PARAO|nr:unnamed protein product [Parnassius apollo]